MVLACFHTWVSFIFAALSKNTITVHSTAIVLFLAMGVTSLHHQRPWRKITVIILQTTCFLVVVSGMIYRLYPFKRPFWTLGWISEPSFGEIATKEWPIFFLIFASLWILWFCGGRIVKKSPTKALISARFDIGLSFLLLLLIIKLVMAGKKVELPLDHSSVKAIIAFMVISLFAMGLTHMGNASKTGRTTYLKGAGIVLTFTAVVFMLGGGLFILFLPQMQSVAETGYDLLGNAKGPLKRLIIFLVRIYQGGGFRQQSGEEVEVEQMIPTFDKSGEALGVFDYLFIGFSVSLLTVATGYVMYRILRWLAARIAGLFSKPTQNGHKTGIWEQIVLLIRSITHMIIVFFTSLFYRLDPDSIAIGLYRRVLRWGRLSGVSRADWQTPKEYGRLLGRRFPRVNKEIGAIIQLHDEIIYGCILPDGGEVKQAVRAWRKMRHPSLWFERMKSLLF